MNETQKRLVGKRISQIRDKHDITLEEFGKVIDNANKSNVSKWEKGEVLPNRKRLKMIAEFGDTTLEYLLTGKEMRDLEGNLMPKGFRLFDYEFVGHHSQKLKDSPVRVVYSFLCLSDGETLYYCGMRSFIMLGNIDVGIQTAPITIVSESLEKNAFFNSAHSANIKLKKVTTGDIPFTTADRYIHSISTGDKGRGISFLSDLSNVLLKVIKQDNELSFGNVDFKGSFHYFRSGTTKDISIKIN